MSEPEKLTEDQAHTLLSQLLHLTASEVASLRHEVDHPIFGATRNLFTPADAPDGAAPISVTVVCVADGNPEFLKKLYQLLETEAGCKFEVQPDEPKPETPNGAADSEG